MAQRGTCDGSHDSEQDELLIVVDLAKNCGPRFGCACCDMKYF